MRRAYVDGYGEGFHAQEYDPETAWRLYIQDMGGENCASLQPLQCASYECGLCKHGYTVTMKSGERRIVTCPRCRNATLQMLFCP